MKTVIRKEILLMLREKGTFFWLFLMPALFIVIFAAIFGHMDRAITVHYVDADRTEASRQFLDALAGIKGYQLETDDSLTTEQQIQKIKEGKMSALLVVPKGFAAALQGGESQAAVQLYRDAAADQAVAPIYAVLQQVANRYREEKLAGTLAQLGKTAPEVQRILMPPVRVDEIREHADTIDAIAQIVPGYTVMFVFFIMIPMTRRFMKEKESGLLARMRCTPLRPLSYLGGMWVSNMVVVVIQCGTLLTFGRVVYHMNLGDPLAVAAIVLCLAVCGTGLGLALSMWVKSENQGVGVTQIVTMGGAVAGGLWFPSDLLPKAVQVVGMFTPQYWAQHSLQDVMIRGAHLADVWPALAVLLGFGAAGLALALLRFPAFMLDAAHK